MSTSLFFLQSASFCVILLFIHVLLFCSFSRPLFTLKDFLSTSFDSLRQLSLFNFSDPFMVCVLAQICDSFNKNCGLESWKQFLISCFEVVQPNFDVTLVALGTYLMVGPLFSFLCWYQELSLPLIICTLHHSHYFMYFCMIYHVIPTSLDRSDVILYSWSMIHTDIIGLMKNLDEVWCGHIKVSKNFFFQGNIQ